LLFRENYPLVSNPEILLRLQDGDTAGLKVLKLKGMSEYRVRGGWFRIRFIINTKTKQVEIYSVKLRNEATYK